MKVNLIRWPNQHDWDRCKLLALGTEGKEAKTSATAEWKHKMLKCEHSPIRTLMFTIQLVDVPYWVSVHYVRHKYGIEHYVRSQRNDRQSQYDRNSAPQNAPVNHIIDVNAQELMFMARKRLCSKAAEETKEVMQAIVDEVVKVCPEFKPFLVPQCAYLGRCPEIYGCGMFRDNHSSTSADGFTFDDYQRSAARTINMTLTDAEKGKHALFGMVSEIGEIHGIYQKRYQGHDFDEEHVKKELGDLIWFVAEYCTAHGWSMTEIAKGNIQKLIDRYPEGFSADKSLHRKEGDI